MTPQPAYKDNQLKWDFKEDTLQFEGYLTLPLLDRNYEDIDSIIKEYNGSHLHVNLNGLKRIDSAGVAYLNSIRRNMEEQGRKLSLEEVPEEINATMEVFTLEKESVELKQDRPNIIFRIGRKSRRFLVEDIPEFIHLLADTLYWSVTDTVIHKHRRKGEFINQTVLIGANAIPIIALISYLIGLVLVLQSAAQLRQFGANIFVADLIVISMTREMGPLLTAIMLAGRSGSAIASEIGTMMVTEEVDALRTMALNPVRYLVIPKMHAMIFSLPLLTMIANLVGILGGVTIAYLYLDINPFVFYNRMSDALIFRDLLTGLIKSLVFAGIIVVTASYYGFRVEGGSEGVGRITTASVVTSIFLVILADSMLGLLFYFE
ncbi:MAG: MlaE family lipid ABC transporter permease subunit [Calditrichia bacterium]